MFLKFSIYSGSRTEWNDLVSKFDNLTMYQIYEWGKIKESNGWSVIRLIGKNNGKPVSYTQIFHRKVFGVNIIIIPGGPVGQLDYWFSSITDFFSSYFGFFTYCRIYCSYNFGEKILDNINKSFWKKPLLKITSEMTMLLELDKDSDKIKIKCSNNWRYGLNRSTKNKLKVKLIKNPNIKKIFETYSEMEKNKNLPQTYSLKQFNEIFNILSKKLIYFECYNDNNKLIALRGAIYNNNKAWEILAASTNEARKLYATYATEWALIEYCGKIGIKIYDLTGADPKNDPGVYFFKKGTGAQLVECLGEWEFSSLPFYQYLIYLRFKIVLYLKSILKFFFND